MAGQKGKSGGARPGSGRKPNEVRLELQNLLNEGWPLAERQKAIQKLAEQASQGNADAIKTLLAYAYGKPTERKEISGADGQDITIRVLYDDPDD